MTDRFYSGSYSYNYDPYPQNSTSNRNGTYSSYTKPVDDSNNVDIKQSNISQQTIIHKARLYSPDKNQQLMRRNFNNSQAHDKTKARKTEITAKIHQIVDLCEDDEDAEIHEFKEVIQAEKKILNMLHLKNNQESPNLNIELSNVGQDRGTTFGPIRNQSFPIAKYQTKPFNQKEPTNINSVRQTITRDNIYKKSAIDDLKTDRNAEEIDQPYLEGDFVYRNSETSKRPFPKTAVNDQTQKMIEQIERKAMQEIESLRNDKIDLMRKLNQEIRLHNQEKKLRMRLENQLAKIKGHPVPHKQIPQQAIFQSEQINRNPPKRYQPNTQHAPTQDHYQHYQPVEVQYQSQQPKQYHGQPQHQYQPHHHHHQHQLHQPHQTHQTHQPNQTNQAYQIQSRQNGQKNEDASSYERQINRLHTQNSNLMKILKAKDRNVQKQELRNQVTKLNQLIVHYQMELQKFRHQRPDDSFELQSLLQQGERIQQDTWRLLKKQGGDNHIADTYVRQKLFRNESSRNQLIQDANNFKKRLVEYGDENAGLNKNIRLGSRKDIYEDYRASLPVLNSSSYIAPDEKMYEFQRVLGDLRNAAR